MSRQPATTRRTGRLLLALITRLHAYIGLLVAPFMLVAALSGIAYVMTPSLEAWLYRDALNGAQEGTAHPLAMQVEAAQHALNDSTLPAAVRPAPHPGGTTRVMFAAPGLGPSQHRALFVDPVTLEIKGDMTVYGTSGVLPLRTTLDLLHRELLMGDVGRYYSELAASWLWVAAFGGLALWLQRRRALRAQQGPAALRRRHATLGVLAALGLVFFSATGLTWSKWAGGNFAELRHAWGWSTPSVSTLLPETTSQAHGEHAGHGEHGQAQAPDASRLSLVDFDLALSAARSAGIDAGLVQIEPPRDAERAWRVAEIDRSWPTQVDQVALHPQTMAVIERTDFATFPLVAKLTRWGIDLHMGVLFGLPNQLLLAAIATCLVVLVCWGYTMWWRRMRATQHRPQETLSEVFVALPWSARLGVVTIAVALGLAMPVLGTSLLLFVVVDVLRWWAARRRAPALASRQ
ncbi:PepSY domain-containing protein [Halomonas sp. MCCC 1A11036]|uniref:PepSY domain-containing protein n=1 Tax=Billgrantia zhangzhouensis TaxID=2733481 RepID=A0ABS9AFG9_9GAMM|nr:PepSY-associated TM helix domain-containing protein [Halomonas zhangzhouensis]MCE8020465.1 PepSY domain-containing protein [Halomonas zhangzhouensis]